MTVGLILGLTDAMFNKNVVFLQGMGAAMFMVVCCDQLIAMYGKTAGGFLSLESGSCKKNPLNESKVGRTAHARASCQKFVQI